MRTRDLSTRVQRSFLVTLALVLAAARPGDAAPPRVDLVITGTVTTERKQPIFGAHVTIDALAVSVGTDSTGRYRIVIPTMRRGPNVTLRVRSFGYIPQVRAISTSLADTATYDFTLKQDVNRLSQVIVTGVTGVTAATPPAASPSPTPSVILRGPESIGMVPQHPTYLGGESYARVSDNAFVDPLTEPRSTFGIDVDRASYAIVRRTIAQHRSRPVPDAVRIEELINYFPYEYAKPMGRHPFAVETEVSPAPWAPEHLLVRIGLQARTLDLSKAPPSNVVFLIDVSGSMMSENKLPLLKHALRMLVAQLREQDQVAIVTYAGREGLALEPTSGADKERILEVLDRLEAGGSTAGGAGLRLAYDVAHAAYRRGSNNRVILATDGDFNVGVTNNAELERMIERRREEGTALSVLGFGAGNIHDDRMEMLADKGNGNYAFIDSPLEARKVLVNEMGGTLVTVAKDVKLQVEFNPAVVASYRLIGYENRLLATEDFKDDRKDAGDLGAGHSVTALYEVVPVGITTAFATWRSDTLRYQHASLRPVTGRERDRVATPGRERADELMYVRIRYKQPHGKTSIPFEHVVANRVSAPSTDFRFAQAVAAFGLTLRGSDHRGDASAELALELANGALGEDAMGYRRDFVTLVTQYLSLHEVASGHRRR